MIDEANQIENPQESAEAPESLEELKDEDASVEINFEAGFASEGEVKAASHSADQTLEGDTKSTSAEVEDSEQALNHSDLVADLERQVAGLKAQVEDRTGQYMRIAADFDNFRKRTSKEKEDLEVQVKCSAINELLPVVDNFERARSQIKPQTESEMTIHKSYQSVYKQLVDCLKRIGVSAMRAEGQEFDPNLHEAVMREPTDQYPEGTVMEELVRGYLLGERVLRHAMVKVAAAAEPVMDSEEDAEAEVED
ncbi:MAG: nucleotide exchange factor GrpE [Leptolyngbyaceae cyanobacterium MO_188.B28]|nr:nucleotide exchange factor GrpE [Leptolyngbyaceae cyanobacterium MO_188.B28]